MSFNLGKEKVHFNVARLEINGKRFEVVIDPDLAVKFRRNPDNFDIREVLKSEHIFSDAQKGLLASEKLLKEFFGTEDELEIAERILSDGEIEFTSEYREQLLESKRRRIAEIISRSAIDPRTKLPHPMHRILSAMSEAKVRVDMFKKPEDQVKRVVKEIAKIIPISMHSVIFTVKIPAAYSGRAYSTIKAMGTIRSESWLSDGSLKADVEVSAPLELDFIDKINKLTHGDNYITKKEV